VTATTPQIPWLRVFVEGVVIVQSILKTPTPIHSEDFESDPLKHHQVREVSIAPACRGARALFSVASYSRAGSEWATEEQDSGG